MMLHLQLEYLFQVLSITDFSTPQGIIQNDRICTHLNNCTFILIKIKRLKTVDDNVKSHHNSCQRKKHHLYCQSLIDRGMNGRFIEGHSLTSWTFDYSR